MDKLRLVTLAVLLVAAVVVACSEIESPTDVVAAASITAQSPCKVWQCNPAICGHPTWSPYHACCVQTIYDPPDCSYEVPCDPVPEPACDSIGCAGCDLQDNYCWFSGTTCNFDEGLLCGGCCEGEGACYDDPITSGECNTRDGYLHDITLPNERWPNDTCSTPGCFCNEHPSECDYYCAYGHFY
jgi:hypothetical protein